MSDIDDKTDLARSNAFVSAKTPRDQSATTRSDFENLLFDPMVVGAMGRLNRPRTEAWSTDFPDLTILPRGEGAFRPLSICIATEDIVGPVQNGGIGSTYASLAAMLAAAGHQTTILYLAGNRTDSESTDHHIKAYADLGVRLVLVPNYAVREGLRAAKDLWLRIPYNMMRYLADNPFDVVHVSEWRGSGFLSLLAKRQGLAFANTLFVVKTSSPWLWNRMYCSHPLERPEELTRIFAERRSVELADVVVGGSAHLLRWMLSHSYSLPTDRTFVQPNFIDFDEGWQKPRQAPGTRMPIDEIVFFGRLEGRKGLLLFCHAIARLIRQGVKLPPIITFLGKPGVRLNARPDQTVLDFIELESRDWPCEVKVLSEYQQAQAVQYLAAGRRLAVMPSLIENSSMAVYEATLLGVPFLASRVGGTPELIRAVDHPHVLFEPHPIAIADKIAEALTLGGYFAASSFDNAFNIAVWRGFHDDLARGLRDGMLAAATRVHPPSSIAVCIYHTGSLSDLLGTIESIRSQGPETLADLLIAVDASASNAVEVVKAQLAALELPARVIDTADRDAGASFNTLVGHATSDYALLLWAGMMLEPSAVEKLHILVGSSTAHVFNFFFRSVVNNRAQLHALTVDMVGSLSEGFVTTQLLTQPLLVRRDVFARTGGFSTDYRSLGYEQEFLAKAQLAGFTCETALMEIASVPALSREWLWERGYDEVASYLRAVRPQIATAPMAVRDLLLLAKGLMIKTTVAQPKLAPRPQAKASRRSTAGAISTIVKGALSRAKRPDSNAPHPSADAPKAAVLTPARARSLTPARFITDPTKQTQAFQAKILFVRNGTVHGWVIENTDPNRRVLVEAVESGTVIATAIAGERLPLPDGGPHPNISNCGFSLDMFGRRAPGAKRRRSPVTVDVRMADGGRILARNILVFPPGARMERTVFEGYCDRSNDGFVQGWVRSRAVPDEEIDAAILLDGILIGRARANQYRADLLANDIGDGEYGFRFRLSDALRTGEKRVIEVVIAQNGLRLNHSPLVVKDRKVTPRSALFNMLPSL